MQSISNIDKLREKYKKETYERFFDEVFIGEEYKDAREQKANVVLDVGACAGEFAAYMYDLADVIYALEPEEGHFKELSDNVKEFKLNKIKPFKIALSDKNGEEKLYIGTRGGHSLVPTATKDPQAVQTMTLTQFMKENNIEHVNVLKIDIEGAEDSVFKADDFHIVADKIDYIIGEHLGGVFNTLIEYGFKVRETFKNNTSFKK